MKGIMEDRELAYRKASWKIGAGISEGCTMEDRGLAYRKTAWKLGYGYAKRLCHGG